MALKNFGKPENIYEKSMGHLLEDTQYVSNREKFKFKKKNLYSNDLFELFKTPRNNNSKSFKLFALKIL